MGIPTWVLGNLPTSAAYVGGYLNEKSALRTEEKIHIPFTSIYLRFTLHCSFSCTFSWSRYFTLKMGQGRLGGKLPGQVSLLPLRPPDPGATQRAWLECHLQPIPRRRGSRWTHLGAHGCFLYGTRLLGVLES